jgi:hypothetical protein
MTSSEPTSREPGPTPDGSSPQTAISVGSVAEEYAWISRNLPGARLETQSLTYVDEKPFDSLALILESGERRVVIFDISSFFGQEHRRSSSNVPCPYCGAALRTPRSKQCFICGTDWRDPENVIRRGQS